VTSAFEAYTSWASYMTMVIRTRSRARLIAMPVLVFASGFSPLLPPYSWLALVVAVLRESARFVDLSTM
jgi:hypothetical protein